jgi:F420-dependent oxidoreductase-like protein
MNEGGIAMRIGILAGTTGAETVDVYAAEARAAAEAGLHHWWVPQILGLDALAVIGVVAREVPDIGVGTGVVPSWPRHPVVMAQSALTASALSGGRFILGLGLSHQLVIEGMFGIPWDRPVRHLREYLDVLLPLLTERRVSFQGEVYRVQLQLNVEAPTPPVLIAALGPKMLDLAGARTDGTITWMTGPRTLAEHTVPRLRTAAQAAGRSEPRVVAGFPVCVTDDPDAARDRAAKVFTIYGQLPSYRAMLDREGVSGPEGIAVVGNEKEVGGQLAVVEEAGATDLVATPFGRPEERERTFALLSSLASGR